jgi:transcription elongation GreA/GreB family factor
MLWMRDGAVIQHLKMPSLLFKAQVIAHHRAALNETRATLLQNQLAATAGTRVDGDHRPANRGERGAVTAQGYLAHGIGQRIQTIDAALSAIEKIGDGPRDVVTTGALVVVGFETSKRAFAILPGGDGKTITIDQETVTIISADSPIACQLTGLQVDEEGALFLGGCTQEVEIISLC